MINQILFFAVVVDDLTTDDDASENSSPIPSPTRIISVMSDLGEGEDFTSYNYSRDHARSFVSQHSNENKNRKTSVQQLALAGLETSLPAITIQRSDLSKIYLSCVIL